MLLCTIAISVQQMMYGLIYSASDNGVVLYAVQRIMHGFVLCSEADNA